MRSSAIARVLKSGRGRQKGVGGDMTMDERKMHPSFGDGVRS